MSIVAEHLSVALRISRINLGVSQRDLSLKSGIPQAQISKFENGKVDLRLSSLVTLFRALELELELVPRRSVPAVQAIVRTTMKRPTVDPKLIAKAQSALEYIWQKIVDAGYQTNQLERLQDFRSFLGRSLIPADQTDHLKRLVAYLERIQNSPINTKKLEMLLNRSEKFQTQLRNALAQSVETRQPQPAYALENIDQDA